MRFGRTGMPFLLIAFALAVAGCGGHGGGGDDDDDGTGDAGVLPSQCNSATHECTFVGDDAAPLGDVACPAGFSCTFQCSTSGCGAIDCTHGTACTIACQEDSCGDIACGAGSCDISCEGTSQACGAITCGTGRCHVVDNGLNGPATGAIDCRQSCACDVDCSGGTGCPAMRCPEHGDACTSDNTSSGRCDSTVDPACQSC